MSKVRISTKEKEINVLTSTAVNTVSIFISNNDNNDSSFAYGSLASTLHHHRRHIIMINYHYVSSFAFGSLAINTRLRWSLTIAIPLSRFARHIIIGVGGGGCSISTPPPPPPRHRR